MKTKYIHLSIILICVCVSRLSAQHNGFAPGTDTLLFDGETTMNVTDKSEGCKFKVTYIEGKVTGTTTRLTNLRTCGDNWAYETGVYELKEGDMVTSTVKTGDNARIELIAPDNSVLRLGPNSEADIDCNGKFQEEGQKISIKLVLGTIWSHVTHALGGDVAEEVQGMHGVAGVRGTIFSFETKLEGSKYIDILRVYEGKVDFNGNPETQLNKEEIQRRSKELQDDFNAGKISMEEFTNKMKELTNPVIKTAEKYVVMVEAGQESYIRDTDPPTTPAGLTEDPNAWYQDKFFKSK